MVIFSSGWTEISICLFGVEVGLYSTSGFARLFVMKEKCESAISLTFYRVT